MSTPIFDPTKPASGSKPVSADMRNNFNALYNMIPIGSKSPMWFDHFLGSSTDVKYTFIDNPAGGGAGSNGIVNTPNGVLQLSTGGNVDAEHAIQLGDSSIKQFDPTIPFWLEWKFTRYDENSSFFFGLREIDVTSPGVQNFILGILRPNTNSGKFSLESLKSNVSTLADSGISPSAPNTYDIVRIEFDGVILTLKVNGANATTITTNIPIVPLIPHAYVYNVNSMASIVYLDYFGFGLL